jgi:hypothetical protein
MRKGLSGWTRGFNLGRQTEIRGDKVALKRPESAIPTDRYRILILEIFKNLFPEK